MVNEEKKYYIYVHKRNDNSVVFYVGHGRGHRGFEKTSRNKLWHSVVKNAGGFTCVKIIDDLSKEDAIIKERELILGPESSWELVNKAIPCQAKILPLDEARSFVYYSESSPTGLRWAKNIYSGVSHTTLSARIGDVAGCIDKRGYAQVTINKRLHSCHRVVYLLCKGSVDITLVIDHIDGNKSNNNILNLRQIGQGINTRNKTNPRLSKLGLVGVKQDGHYYRSHLGTRQNGSSITKSFSINKYGKEMALYLAVKSRYEYLINQEESIKFTDSHTCMSKLLKIITDFERGQGEYLGIEPTRLLGIE